MNPLLSLLAAACWALGAGLSAAEARTVQYGDVTILPQPDLPQITTHGYHEFSFLVTNTSSTATRRVTLGGPQSRQIDMGLQGMSRIERTATVGPGSTVRLALLQPPLPVFGNGLEVRIDGVLQEEVLAWVSAHPEYWVGNPRHVPSRGPSSRRLLIGQRLSEESFPAHSEDDYRVSRSTMPVTAWSDNWLAYSGYDGLVLSAVELAQAPGGVRRALWRYVEAGGSLVCLGPLAAEAAWARERLERPQVSTLEQGVEVDYAGLGVVLNAPAPTVAELEPGQLDRLEAAWRHSREPWAAARDPAAVHRRFPVASKIEVPVRGLFVVILLFTLLIGPVNLLWLARRGRRMWLLWTVPALSLAACFAVAVWVLTQEGLVRFQRAEYLTVLDERHRQATSYGWLGLYATLTPGEGAEFSLETEVSPIVAWSYDRSRDYSRSLRWGANQHLDEGWLRARLPSYFIVRKSSQQRERVTLRWSGSDAPRAVNGLGVDLEALWVADPTGRLFRAPTAVPAGAAVELTRVVDDAGEATVAGDAGALRRLYHGDLPGRLERLAEAPRESLRPNTYLAVTASSPFVRDGLGGLDRKQQSTLIYGISPQPASELAP
ncbi:MAG: hypothetical protein AAF560_02975 [Acidobacteriota bacterium]